MVNYTHKRGEDYGDGATPPARMCPWRTRTRPGPSRPTRRSRCSSDERSGWPAVAFSSRTRRDVQPGTRADHPGDKRMSDNWQGRSRSFSRNPPSSGRALRRRRRADGHGGTFGQNPNDFVNTEGRLIADRPVMAKAQFVTNAVAVPRRREHPLSDWPPVVAAGPRRRLGFPSRPVINSEANTGDRRVADQTIVDVRLQKDFRIAEPPRRPCSATS